MRNRFIWKLYLGYVVLVLLATLVVSTLIHRAAVRDSLADIERSLEQQAHLLAEIARPVLMGAPDGKLNERVVELGVETGTRLTVIRADGTVLADSHEAPSAMENHGTRPEVIEAHRQGSGTATHYSRTLHQDMLYLALRVEYENEVTGYVRTSLPLTVIAERLAVLRNNVLLGMAIALLFSLPLGYVFARRVTQPLAEMTTAAQAIAAGDHGRKARVQSRDEIGELAGALNEMSAHLAERLETITRDRNQLKAMLGSMADGVVAVDRDAQVVHINATAANLCSVSHGEATGMRTWEVLRIPPLTEAIDLALKEERIVEAEITLAGSDLVYATTVTPWRDGGGSVVGVVAVMHDVSKHRQVERMRQAFIANASHELKSPVTAIRGFAETMLDDPGMDSETRRRFNRSIVEETARMSGLVRDMLALSRAESGGQQKNDEPFDLRDAATAAVEAHHHRAKHQGVQLDYMHCEEPVIITGSPDALATAVGNIVDNALNYTAAGGSVRMSVLRQDDFGLISVADSGCGIAQEHHERIFERFYRVDKARSRELGGTGLGLAIVKHIVLSHGGTVSVESTQGKGSTFSIRLPLAQRDRLS
jgi:two-component system phosphate regulon sensor histidine kinase PhoR